MRRPWPHRDFEFNWSPRDSGLLTISLHWFQTRVRLGRFCGWEMLYICWWHHGLDSQWWIWCCAWKSYVRDLPWYFRSFPGREGRSDGEGYEGKVWNELEDLIGHYGRHWKTFSMEFPLFFHMDSPFFTIEEDTISHGNNSLEIRTRVFNARLEREIRRMACWTVWKTQSGCHWSHPSGSALDFQCEFQETNLSLIARSMIQSLWNGWEKYSWLPSMVGSRLWLQQLEAHYCLGVISPRIHASVRNKFLPLSQRHTWRLEVVRTSFYIEDQSWNQ